MLRLLLRARAPRKATIRGFKSVPLYTNQLNRLASEAPSGLRSLASFAGVEQQLRPHTLHCRALTQHRLSRGHRHPLCLQQQHGFAIDSPHETAEPARTEAPLQGAPPCWLEFGTWAPSSSGSCLAGQNNTRVLAVVDSEEPSLDMPPRASLTPSLEVSYHERFSSVGRIPPTGNRRDGGSTSSARKGALLGQVLTALLPRGYARRVQVTLDVMAWDGKSDLEVLALTAALAALRNANLPIGTCPGVARVSRIQGSLVTNPTAQQQAGADLSLLYAGAGSTANLVHMQGNNLGLDEVMAAISKAQAAAAPLAATLAAIPSSAPEPADTDVQSVDPAALASLSRLLQAEVDSIVGAHEQGEAAQKAALDQLLRHLPDRLRANGSFRMDRIRMAGSGAVSPNDMRLGWPALMHRTLAELAFSHNRRMDGRGLHNSRRLHLQPSPLPTPVHASALTRQGQACSLGSITMGSLGDALQVQELKRMDPHRLFCFLRRPQHAGKEGASATFLVLYGAGGNAQNGAFGAVTLVHHDTSGWTIRVPLCAMSAEQYHARTESEASTLGLLEDSFQEAVPAVAGLPFAIRGQVDVLGEPYGSEASSAVTALSAALHRLNLKCIPVLAGASVGCIQEPPDPSAPPDAAVSPLRRDLWLDPSPLEASVSTWQLHTSGSADSFAALRLECRHAGADVAQLEQALKLSLQQQGAHCQAIQSSVQQVPATAGTLVLPVAKEQVGAIIGTGGSVIRGLQDTTGAQISVVEDGAKPAVHVYGSTAQQLRDCETAILQITGGNIKDGEEYEAEVVKIMEFGAFVDLPGGFGALLHISELAHYRVRRVEDELTLGDIVTVRVLGRNDRGQIRLTRKDVGLPLAARAA